MFTYCYMRWTVTSDNSYKILSVTDLGMYLGSKDRPTALDWPSLTCIKKSWRLFTRDTKYLHYSRFRFTVMLLLNAFSLNWLDTIVWRHHKTGLYNSVKVLSPLCMYASVSLSVYLSVYVCLSLSHIRGNRDYSCVVWRILC